MKKSKEPAKNPRGPKKGKRVTGLMICGNGKRGPLYPTEKTPHDLLLP